MLLLDGNENVFPSLGYKMIQQSYQSMDGAQAEPLPNPLEEEELIQPRFVNYLGIPDKYECYQKWNEQQMSLHWWAEA